MEYQSVKGSINNEANAEVFQTYNEKAKVTPIGRLEKSKTGNRRQYWLDFITRLSLKELREVANRNLGKVTKR